MPDDLRAYFFSRQNELVELVRQLVELESPSESKPALDRLSQFVAAQLCDLGAQVTTVPQDKVGDHLLATFREGGAGGPVVTLCHLDTVWPLGTLAARPWREEEGKLYGPGAFDMKAGTAILLTVLRYLRETNTPPARPLQMLFTTDEETGSATSRALIESTAREAALVICLEPALPGGALKTFRKGTGGFTITAHGRAAHAGADHAQGINAIEEIARQTLALQQMTDYDLGTTVNVGVIAGGSVSNVVPERAQIQVDIRVSTRAEGERMVKAITGLSPQLPGARLDIAGGLDRPPMERTPQIVAAFQKAQAIGASLGLDLIEGATGGASDGNFTGALGLPTLDGMGALGEGGHAAHEHVLARSLPERAALLAAILTQW